jgi:hypothetical protein
MASEKMTEPEMPEEIYINPDTGMQEGYYRGHNLVVYLRADKSDEKETLAKWMTHHGFTTGHGDTIEGLLNELSWQIAALKAERDEWKNKYFHKITEPVR